MALQCVTRNLSKYAQLSSKQYFSGVMLSRSTSVLSAPKSNESRIKSYYNLKSEALKFSAVYACRTISFSQVKEFSVTPNNRSAAAHDHAKLWTAERILSAGLIGVVPAAFLFPSQAMDTLLAVSVVMHNHWGIEAIVVDYVRPIIFGPVVPKIALGLMYSLSIATLIGLFYIIYNGNGLVNTIQMFWKV